MITILYTYRNRDLVRIKRTLHSLSKQSLSNFKVLFLDYGSKKNLAYEVEQLIKEYDFANYEYLFTELQPWNKAKALNHAIKKVDTDYCFIADVDMIFHPKFTSVLEDKIHSNKIAYFQVGFLSKEESVKEIAFEEYKINFKSNEEATGMTLFPLAALHLINGYDEFFHFWGSEDTDIQNRLRNAGFEIEYCNDEVLLLHQWHKNYRSRETKALNPELQLSRTVEMNHLHLQTNLINKRTQVNESGWGMIISENEFIELKKETPRVITSKKVQIDYFLFNELPMLKGKIISVVFIEDPMISEFKYKVKKIMGKKVPEFYTLKEINDRVLLHIISFYHQVPYNYSISPDLKSITFSIKK
ncbi:glycosyltransferase [Flavobacterium sp. ZT3R18]|uniref:glycosyltransferase family 2 protein n=1 Tax=Flavobacterium sp. ZT3R18 TaxID=2594429 RepID=UPI00117B1178|nr:glycosyltransferase [Flavobacterium sp. ZT3R18]TRX34840.1 glycosyltransferase [Flavobacterium sp. ZT3R18]